MSETDARAPAPSWLPRVLAESLLIALSILLALAVDEWRDDRRERERLVEAMDQFRDELRWNHDMVAGALPYHEWVAGQLRSLAGGSYGSFNEVSAAMGEGFTGFQPATFRETAWRAALAGDVFGEVGYDTLAVLSSVYLEQEVLGQINRRILAVATDPQNIRGDMLGTTLQSAAISFNDVLFAENRLLRRYEEALALLGDSASPASP